LGEGTVIENVVPEHITETEFTAGAAGTDAIGTVMAVRDEELQVFNVAPT
jgi:hypothetical protein